MSESDREAVTKAYHGLCQTLEPQRLVMVSTVIQSSLARMLVLTRYYQEFTFTSGRCVQAQVRYLVEAILVISC